jgi:hypothetical protein
MKRLILYNKLVSYNKKVIVLVKIVVAFVFFLTGVCAYSQQRIDRRALVERHTIIVNKADSLSSLSAGNGRFAFTVDVTGLQSFPEAYASGVPLGTESEWGWHSFIDTAGYKREEALKTYHLNGRTGGVKTRTGCNWATWGLRS